MIQKKIFSDIQSFLSSSSSKLIGKKIVFTNGCFDILHPGHVHYLAEAKNKGDLLIVGINSDNSIKRIKGTQRPINNIDYRTQILAGLSSVNYIIVFNDETPLHLIENIRPDVLVKGADYSLDQVVGAEFVQSIGGEVCLIPILEGYSTTKWIERLIKQAE